MRVERVPERFRDDYEVVAELGVGGQGETLRAERRSDGHAVVIKLLDFVELTSWKDLELMQREMRVLASLDHPAIPRLLAHYPTEDEADEIPEAFVIVQDYVDGASLDDAIARSMDEHGVPLFDEDAARTFLGEMLGVLEYLHELNPPVVHRDIKPSNIVQRPDGAFALIDFGAARAAADMTGSTTFVGTNGYMPPEQLMGRSVPASDLYALGATTVELMTGMHPSNLTGEDLSFRLDVVDASPEFVAFLGVLTHPSPQRRYESARRARRALTDPATALIVAEDGSFGCDVQRRADGALSIRLPTPRRRGLLVLAAAVLALTILAAFVNPVVILAAVLVAPFPVMGLLMNPRWEIELTPDELRVKRTSGPYSRRYRWGYGEVTDVWSGPAPTFTSVLIQAADGSQTAVRSKALTPEQHHRLGDVLRNYVEEHR